MVHVHLRSHPAMVHGLAHLGHVLLRGRESAVPRGPLPHERGLLARQAQVRARPATRHVRDAQLAQELARSCAQRERARSRLLLDQSRRGRAQKGLRKGQGRVRQADCRASSTAQTTSSQILLHEH